MGGHLPHGVQQSDLLHTPGHHCDELCQDIPHINQVQDQECHWNFDKLSFRRSNAISRAVPQTSELGQALLRPTNSTTAKRTEPIVKKSAMKVRDFPLKCRCRGALPFISAAF